MKSSEFDYELPESLIARYPLDSRDMSRLLVFDRSCRKIEDKEFSNLLDYINHGDLLVFNDSKVMAARLYGEKSSGGKVEILIERVISPSEIIAHMKSNKSPKIGSDIIIGGSVFNILSKDGTLYHFILRDGSIWDIMENDGHMPLPPYMKRIDEKSDRERYQTVYSKMLGSVAAPTAGLHFTNELIDKIEKKTGQDVGFVTLHVGSGTFQPVKVEDVNKHQMHSEYIEVNQELCDKITETKARGNRVIAVGTTTVRSLESAALSGQLSEYIGESDIFLYPGKKFNVVDGMVTNFHLPKSTLIMLVSAFSTRDDILSVYKHAVKSSYRFFSYGDAMLII